MQDVFIHEDEFYQSELYPLYKLNLVKKELEHINNLKPQNHNEDIHTTKYIRYEFHEEELKVIAHKFPKVKLFAIDHYEQKIPADNSTVFEITEKVYLIFDHKNNHINRIWLHHFLTEKDQINKFITALKNIPTINEMVYVDWEWGVCFLGSEIETAKEKFYNRAEKMKKTQEEL